MNASTPLRQALKVAVVGVALHFSAVALAKTTGVGDDPALQTGPCYEALVDKNAATPTTAPNRELGSACEAEHGDVEKAWARVIRLWGSDSTDIPDYDSYRRADAPVSGAAPKWLAVVGILLSYAVLGTPMRSAARLLGAYPGPAKGAIVDLVASLVLRGLIGAAFIALFGLPYLAALGAAALIAWAVIRLGRAAPAAARALRGLAQRTCSRGDQRSRGRRGRARRLSAFCATQLLDVRPRPGAGACRFGGPCHRGAAGVASDASSRRDRRRRARRRPRRGYGRRASRLGLGRRIDRREISLLRSYLRD